MARFLFSLLLLMISSGLAAEPREVDYLRDVQPIFRQRCYPCHGALKQEAGLRLDTVAAIAQGGASGPGFEVGNVAASPILQRTQSTDLSMRMPPEGQGLSADEVAILTAWIAGGGKGPPLDLPEASPEDHWAFQPPQRSIASLACVPASGNLIDHFIESALHRAGITAGPQADRRTQLRRLYLDLVGIPPSPAEIDEFLADADPHAYDKIVDRLLASPRYGQRWGRHWMDVWRYADWFGRRYVPDVWNSAPQIWRWRDWIVQSLNEDLPYDQMIRLMLAADEVAPGDPEDSVATGFLIRNWYALNPNDWMRSNVEHTSKAFLGLTIHCAHCHDHKYDPLSQTDYFRFRAFFEPIAIRQDRVIGQPDPGPFQEYEYSKLRTVQRLGAVSIFDKHPEATTWFYTGGDERNRLTARGSIAPGIPSFFERPSPIAIEPLTLPLEAWYPAMRPESYAMLHRERREHLEAASQAATQAAAQPTADTSALDAQQQRLEEELRNAEAELATAAAAEAATISHPPLTGSGSLLLSALAGRRMIYRAMDDLPPLVDGDLVEFDLQLLSSAHFNFQLTRNNITGATATFVGFDSGRILAYRPGGFEEFQVGSYDLGGEPATIHVVLRLDPERDICELQIDRSRDRTSLVAPVSIALNGWNPHGRPEQGFLLDARSGAAAAVDGLRLLRREGVSRESVRTLVEFDFEAPRFPAGEDLVGRDGWRLAEAYCQPPATSNVVASIPDLAATARTQQKTIRRDAARRALRRSEYPSVIAQAKLRSAQISLAEFERRLAAEQARYRPSASAGAGNWEHLAAEAHQLQLMSQLGAAEVESLEAQAQLAIEEAKPADDPQRTPNIASQLQRLQQAEAKAAELQRRLDTERGSTEYAPLGPQYPQTSTGRRAALAHWITSPTNPLTARVAVNHLWLRHFHRPLVETVFNFGRSGALPTHPELLDALAVELIQSQWSMKHLHRLIVTSDAYRRSSAFAGGASARSIDPENKLLWRMNSGRMEAEVLRDSLLALAGELDEQFGGQELENRESLTTSRRSLYYSCQPEDDGKSPLGMLFDGPDSNDCYRRTQTVIPQQPLALTNSPWIHHVSDRIAASIEGQIRSGSTREDRRFIEAAYVRLLGRLPRPEELQRCEQFLQGPSSQLRIDSPDEPLYSSLVRVLLNHHDFITVP